MVITMLEATVDRNRLQELENGYREIASELPDIIAETFLVRDREDETSCKILTVWTSIDALTGMRDRAQAAGSKPNGVLLFESVGVTPQLKILEVVEHATHQKPE